MGANLPRVHLRPEWSERCVISKGWKLILEIRAINIGDKNMKLKIRNTIRTLDVIHTSYLQS